MTNPDDCLSTIDWPALYDGLLDGFAAPRSERAAIDAQFGRGAAAYGEIEPHSADRLLRWLAPRSDDVLFDLGSGTGRLLTQALCTTPIGGVVGVELCAHRHTTATEVRRRLIDELDPRSAALTAPRFELRHEDARTTDVTDATLVYLGATCFPDSLLRAILQNVVTNAPRLRALATARPLPNGAPRALVEIGRVDLAMTWAERVGVHVYARHGQCNHLAAPLQNPA